MTWEVALTCVGIFAVSTALGYWFPPRSPRDDYWDGYYDGRRRR